MQIVAFTPWFAAAVSDASASDDDTLDEALDEALDEEAHDTNAAPLATEGAGVRPGIVHRLDVGTTGWSTHARGQRTHVVRWQRSRVVCVAFVCPAKCAACATATIVVKMHSQACWWSPRTRRPCGGSARSSRCEWVLLRVHAHTPYCCRSCTAAPRRSWACAHSTHAPGTHTPGTWHTRTCNAAHRSAQCSVPTTQ